MRDNEAYDGAFETMIDQYLKITEAEQTELDKYEGGIDIDPSTEIKKLVQVLKHKLIQQQNMFK